MIGRISYLRATVSLVALVFSWTTFAAEIIVFSDADFSGESRSYSSDVINLDHKGFNDRISSIQIVSGRWKVCADSGFRGRCESFSENVPNLASIGLNDTISSIGLESTFVDEVDDLEQSQNTQAGLVLYSFTNFRGNEVEVSSDVSDQREINFDNRTSSVQVLTGIWELCEDVDFGGQCLTVSRSESSLKELNNRVSSVRLIGRRLDAIESWDDENTVTQCYDHPEEYQSIVYTDSGYRGRKQEIDGGITDFSTIGFNDQVSSFRLDGRWQVCEDANYQGECETFRFDELNLALNGWNDRISSMRPAREAEGSVLSLYEHDNFGGQEQQLHENEPDLSRIGFNNEASSLRVLNGTWEICEDVQYRGRCELVSTDRKNLRSVRLNDRVSSARNVD